MSAVALRGPAPPAARATGPAAGDAPAGGGARGARGAPGGPLLPLWVARAIAFLGLAIFGSLHWMRMLEPAASFRAWESVGISVAMIAGLLGAARIGSPALRSLAAAAVTAAGLALAFLAAGVADEFLRPERWGTLASGIGRGIDALPGARVPFRGLDEWTRATIAVGGTALVVLAAALAFWPRSRGRLGFRGLALLALVTLYVVPTVTLFLDHDFLRGAVLVILLVAFLRLERLRRTEAAAAGAAALAVVLLALVVAPALNRPAPWWDYEAWALNAASSKTTSFSWDHAYGPLDWPRDGRELLRVKAPAAAYWKAENLDAFDGRTWRRTFYSRNAPMAQLPDPVADRRSADRWLQEIEVTVRNLQSREVLTAGAPLAVESTRSTTEVTPGVYLTTSRPLRRGDTYKATVYTPDPSPAQLRGAGVDYAGWLDQYRSIGIDAGVTDRSGERVEFAPFGIPAEPRLVNRLGPSRPAAAALEASELERTWALAQRLRESAITPYGYATSIERYLADSAFVYSETPPPSASTLEGFLFDARAGYCQQFSGAMALLLRMGGVPARVSAGFTSGSLDKKTGEYVVRDLDAHSWVEAWFPGYGWVTFDPTPSAAPPRSQAADTAAAAQVEGRAPDLGSSDRASDPASTLAQTEDGTAWGWYALGAGAAALLLAAAVLHRRRRRRRPAGEPPWAPALAELERALRRAGRRPTPGTTLSGLEHGFAGQEAAGYVRALREQRYRDAAPGPTPAQRRGLRAELARGGGIGGRLRAWWALPPRGPARVRRLGN